MGIDYSVAKKRQLIKRSFAYMQINVNNSHRLFFPLCFLVFNSFHFFFFFCKNVLSFFPATNCPLLMR